jgi:hypothetical protein
MATKLSRTDRLRILAALILASGVAGCNFPIPMWPKLPAQGTCRNFYMTSWGGGAPWDELRWGVDLVHIDEPMLPMWGWKGNLASREDVCGPDGIQMVRAKVDALRAANPGKVVWLNWSTDEIDAMAAADCGEPLGLGADVVSVDSYGGVWDYPGHLSWILEMMHATLEPGQMLGLVPEAHYFPAGGIDWPPIDYVLLSHLFFDFAVRHDRIYALAPFTWWDARGAFLGMESNPQVAEAYAALAREHPRCAE